MKLRLSKIASKRADVLRVLPFIAVFLWVAPILFLKEEVTQKQLPTIFIFVFGVWLALIVIAALFSSILPQDPPRQDDEK